MPMKYAVLDLGGWHAPDPCTPYAISANGRQIAGAATAIDNQSTKVTRPFLSADQGNLNYSMQLVASPAPPSVEAYATAVNGNGDVAGNFGAAQGRSAFVTPRAQQSVELTPLLGTPTVCYALAMNEAGDVVGYMGQPPHSPTSGPTSGWLYTNGAAIELSVAKVDLGSSLVEAQIADVQGINDAKLIVGRFATAEAFTFDFGSKSVRPLGIQTLGPAVGRRLFVNNPGQVAGNRLDDVAFLRQPNGKVILLATQYPLAGMNNHGMLIASNGLDAFSSDPTAPLQPYAPPLLSVNLRLTTPGWYVTDVHDIDDAGAIVGTARRIDGAVRGVLLVPDGQWEKVPSNPLGLVVRLLGGIPYDGPGRTYPGGPVPPWQWYEFLTNGERDALIGVAFNAGARLVTSARSREALQQVSADLVRDASGRLNDVPDLPGHGPAKPNRE